MSRLLNYSLGTSTEKQKHKYEVRTSQTWMSHCAGLEVCSLVCSHLAAVWTSRTEPLIEFIPQTGVLAGRFIWGLSSLLCKTVQCSSCYCLLSVGGGVNMVSPYQHNLCSSCYLPLWSQTKDEERWSIGCCLWEMSDWYVSGWCRLPALHFDKCQRGWRLMQTISSSVHRWDSGLRAAGRPHRGYVPEEVGSLQKVKTSKEEPQPTFTGDLFSLWLLLMPLYKTKD